ncbi:choloylglycine hydrolase family protein [Enterococcus sp. 5H]|uniref:choloylglycine hydrolase family protein n=1 Tax=Enterococcus sp. 5H TaxID=1229490 RepID=UPI00230484FC|nr:choloylglycine hydrolase family protein [Enterococcus sp. 5H]MDA9472477.1 hypothetical protein [Enterococcus sp. 5H]
MCTSIFTKTLDGKYLLSRTMDFSFPLDARPIYIPAEYKWESVADNKKHKSDYGFIGAGRLLGEGYFVADGVNEHGLSVAELYLPGEAKYQDYTESNSINLAPHEVILWLLGNMTSVEDVKKNIGTLNIVGVAAPLLNIVTPLHWIITDAEGNSTVIEPTEKHLKPKENPVGVMTNTPQLEWHIENLRNYLPVRPKQYAPETFGEYVAEPFSQGTGTMGLPGGYTPPERFVRAAFFKEHIEPAKDETEGVNNAQHILNTVRIPKGIVVTQNGEEDYSLYSGTMVNNTQTYYYTSYENHQITKLVLDKELLSKKEPIVFKYQGDTESFDVLNTRL